MDPTDMSLAFKALIYLADDLISKNAINACTEEYAIVMWLVDVSMAR
jgi:hypothetical protein